MASVVTAAATTAASAASATATNRVTPQGGILEGADPSVYDSKNPIILFIIQVSHTSRNGNIGRIMQRSIFKSLVYRVHVRVL
jgi:hypothetical protein